MEETHLVTRSELIEAFRNWHADCPKTADGTLAGIMPDDAEKQADTLLEYLIPVIG